MEPRNNTRIGSKAARIFAILAVVASGAASAATTISHSAIGYFVPDKRINIDASISDPSGIKLARVYFKPAAQADYLLVPMRSEGANRFVGTIPAPSASTTKLDYLVLAVNNAGQVSRTDAYTASERNSRQTPAWQSTPSQEPVKVYTELPSAPSPSAAFSDSISMDVVESGARFGAVAGLYGGQAGGAAGGAAGSSGTTTAATTSATAGGLSTAAIVGGVAIAGGLAAAAASGGGGGGGGSPSGSSSFVGNWSGSWSYSETGSGSGCVNDTCSGSWSGNVSSSGSVTGTESGGCTFGGIPQSGAGGFTGSVSSSGTANVTLSGGLSSLFSCNAMTLQFKASPRGVTGSGNCSYTAGSCTYNGHINISGS